MTGTGKVARQQRGTRVACKRARRRRFRTSKRFGELPVSVKAGNALSYRAPAAACPCANGHANWCRVGRGRGAV